MCSAGQGVPYDAVAPFRAQQDADSPCVAVTAAQLILDQGDVEAELAGVLRLEGADLELDDDLANLVGVEEQMFP